eukprot:TRINITY_DN7612_c0_g1_i2.p1 TRINITY_DN7612_c0_g1~~TRINITY_DN7612_c0_g1_i2.p1  ORF type:complete len:390 (-),score=167.11 TRINITY_DN7612_c0_g1_i2:62-1231(-)
MSRLGRSRAMPMPCSLVAVSVALWSLVAAVRVDDDVYVTSEGGAEVGIGAAGSSATWFTAAELTTTAPAEEPTTPPVAEKKAEEKKPEQAAAASPPKDSKPEEKKSEQPAASWGPPKDKKPEEKKPERPVATPPKEKKLKEATGPDFAALARAAEGQAQNEQDVDNVLAKDRQATQEATKARYIAEQKKAEASKANRKAAAVTDFHEMEVAEAKRKILQAQVDQNNTINSLHVAKDGSLQRAVHMTKVAQALSQRVHNFATSNDTVDYEALPCSLKQMYKARRKETLDGMVAKEKAAWDEADKAESDLQRLSTDEEAAIRKARLDLHKQEADVKKVEFERDQAEHQGSINATRAVAEAQSAKLQADEAEALENTTHAESSQFTTTLPTS